MQEAIRELEEEFHRSTERLLAGLFRASIRRMGQILKHGDDKTALRAIELVWTAQGRLQRSKGAGGTNVFNQQLIAQPVFDRADARAAMALLRQERERQEREVRAIQDARGSNGLSL